MKEADSQHQRTVVTWRAYSDAPLEAVIWLGWVFVESPFAHCSENGASRPETGLGVPPEGYH